MFINRISFLKSYPSIRLPAASQSQSATICLFPAWKVLTGGCMSQSLFQMDFGIIFYFLFSIAYFYRKISVFFCIMVYFSSKASASFISKDRFSGESFSHFLINLWYFRYRRICSWQIALTKTEVTNDRFWIIFFSIIANMKKVSTFEGLQFVRILANSPIREFCKKL